MAKEKEEKKLDTTKTTDTPQDNTVTVDRGMMDKLLARLDQLESESALLKGIAGKNAIKDFQDKARDFTIKRAYLKVIDGKTVVGWDTLEQDVWKNDGGVWVESLKTTVRFEDGTKQEMRYIDFEREKGMKSFVIRAITEDIKEGTIYTLEGGEGEVLRIPVAFLNP